MKIFNMALTALALLPVAAQAQEAKPVVRVVHADLNLQTKAGVKTLDRRLAWAIRSVCLASESTVDTGRQFAARRCVLKKTAEMAALRNQVVAAQVSRAQMAGGSR
jgi:UrcA family protein